MGFLDWDTNVRIVDFATKNIILLFLIQRVLKYICDKTPWAVDNDLPSFFGGLISVARGGKVAEVEEAKDG